VCFQEIKFLAGKQNFFKYPAIITFVAVPYTASESARFRPISGFRREVDEVCALLGYDTFFEGIS
jgi:hypothetical protein